jgi:NADH-quinone oxidoreductase subunit A
MLSEYLPIVIFLGIAFMLSTLMVVLARFFGGQHADQQKLSSYECGFPPFADVRQRFEVRFYLIALLFIIFDLEVAFLFPWAISLNKIGWFGFWAMGLFLLILAVGFIYEWLKGALEWE